MSAILTKSEQFIRDLDRVSATHAASLKDDSSLKNLDKVGRRTGIKYRSVVSVPDHDLSKLARRFRVIKDSAINDLGGKDWLKKLPANDPLRCRVGLFGTLDLGLRETAHTRALAWLLDPRAEHGFGDALLQAFLQDAFRLSGSPELTDVRVSSELPSGKSQDRLDIFLEGRWTLPERQAEDWMVIVEAKIQAVEGEDQCARYESQFRKRMAGSDRTSLVFLTPEGRKAKSSTNRGTSGWKTLSFIRLMALFRQRLPSLEGLPGVEFLRLYMTGVLEDLYDLYCGRIGECDDVYRICEYLSGETSGGKQI